MTKHKVPPWLSSHIDAAGLEQVSQAVATAEKQTSCEIVPMIVRRVYRPFHLNIVLFLALETLLGLAVLYISHIHPTFHTALAIVIGTVAALIVSPLLTRSSQLERFMVDQLAVSRAVQARAELEFYRQGLNITAQGTGILIFIAWWDRQVVVLADKQIAAGFSPTYWDKTVATILQSVRRRSLAAGLTQAIADCGQQLASLFPVGANDINELSDQVIIIEDE